MISFELFTCQIHRCIRFFERLGFSLSTTRLHDHYHCKHNELRYTFLSDPGTGTLARKLTREPSQDHPLNRTTSSRNPLPQRRRQRLIRLRPHLDITILLHQQITYQPPKHHTPPLIQMRPVIRQVIILPAGFWPDRVDVVCAGAVEIDPACS